MGTDRWIDWVRCFLSFFSCFCLPAGGRREGFKFVSDIGGGGGKYKGNLKRGGNDIKREVSRDFKEEWEINEKKGGKENV